MVTGCHRNTTLGRHLVRLCGLGQRAEDHTPSARLPCIELEQLISKLGCTRCYGGTLGDDGVELRRSIGDG